MTHNHPQKYVNAAKQACMKCATSTMASCHMKACIVVLTTPNSGGNLPGCLVRQSKKEHLELRTKGWVTRGVLRLVHLDGAALADAAAHKQPASQPGVLWIATPQGTPLLASACFHQA